MSGEKISDFSSSAEVLGLTSDPSTLDVCNRAATAPTVTLFFAFPV